ncbi:MAG: hypothetical protein RL160_1793 [Bacteroidota bacterium]
MHTSLNFALQLISEAYAKEAGSGSKFRYLDLYRAVKSCISRQEIPPNWRLPSSRQLAERLGLSRTTVNTAYELLLLEKLIAARAGSGYWVLSEAMAPEIPVATAAGVHEYPALSAFGDAVLGHIGLMNRAPDVGIAFKPGLPPIDIFPINRWKNLLNSYWRHIRSSDLSYGQSTAAQHLQQQICNYLHVNRSIRVHPNQIVVVSGSLQSLYFIASALIDPGDTVVIENPTFPNVQAVFRSFRARVHGIEPDAEGLQLFGEHDLRTIQPKLIHVTPPDHYPLGIKMSLERRLELLRQASECKALVIENDYEQEIANSREKIPTIFSLDKEQRTIYLGTFNRLLYPSIRLGFMVLPPHLVAVVKAFEEHSHRFVSPSLQMVMGQFIERNHLYQHLKNLREVAAERLEVFRNSFRETVRPMELMETGFRSLHVVALFRESSDIQREQALIQALGKKGIAAFPLSNCYTGAYKQPGLILGYSTVSPSAIRHKLYIIQDVLETL